MSIRRLGLGAAVLTVLIVSSGVYSEDGEPLSREERMERSPQYEDGRFVNTETTTMAFEEAGTAERVEVLGEFMRDDSEREPTQPLPLHNLTSPELADPPADGIRVTWMGHATVLLEIEGRRILADPIWSKRAGPSSLIGPTRFHAPPIPLADLPPLDAVIISHDHYDHLDKNTLLDLADAQPELRFVVPLGVGGRLEAWGIALSRIIELDWWEETHVVSGLRLICTPARHFSGRGLGDRDSTLWSSWAIVGEQRRAYFGGDTGMFDGFAEIGERLGPFDLTMMPIGAYNDRWAEIHITPEQAVLAHEMLRGKALLPIHWGTFNLAFHGWREPVERLSATGSSQLLLPKLGEPVTLGAQPATWTPWWRQE